jgi:hypothetical protein
LTTAQKSIWESHTGGTFPFLDFGGKEDLTTAQYDPSLLEGPSFDTIASDIGHNSTTIGADIDASADLLVQTICGSLTDQKPADVCSAT